MPAVLAAKRTSPSTTRKLDIHKTVFLKSSSPEIGESGPGVIFIPNIIYAPSTPVPQSFHRLPFTPWIPAEVKRTARLTLHRSYREPNQRYTETNVDVEVPRREQEIDITEREYRRRVHPTYDVAYESRIAGPRVDAEFEAGRSSSGSREDIKVTTDTRARSPHRFNMGYFDDEGHYHSFRHGLEKAADRVLHPFHRHHHRDEVIVTDQESGPTRIRDGVRESVRFVERGGGPDTITIPCHHIRVGDLLVLQGRPCQVIRITTSAQTGQHRYLGVDLFTKQLHEESSFVSNPAPSVIVQNMLGPVFRQYRVLDIRNDGRVVAMTESGDVKQGLPVIDQGGLWSRLNEDFANGRGSVRVLVINDGGRELAVDYKVIHGSRL